MKKKIAILSLIILGVAVLANPVYADGAWDWWHKSTDFFNGGSATAIGPMDDLKSLIKVVGNMLFFVVTVILGIRYIWGSVESKANIKDNLITLVVAAIAFYSWTTIEELFFTTATVITETGETITVNRLVFLADGPLVSAQNIYSTILYICNFFAIGGIVYVGVRYLMAGAEGKAALKAKSIPMILGIIMVYATLEFLNLIVAIV